VQPYRLAARHQASVRFETPPGTTRSSRLGFLRYSVASRPATATVLLCLHLGLLPSDVCGVYRLKCDDGFSALSHQCLLLFGWGS
jgi:hypothetical protein